MIKFAKYLITILILSIVLSGCGNPIHEYKINKAYSQLKMGMTKSELDNLFGKSNALKDRTVLRSPEVTEEIKRLSLQNNYSYKDLYPKDIFDNIPLDGSVKVFSYLINKKSIWPNGWSTYYAAVFYDTKKHKVIGWAKISEWGDISIDNF